MPLLMQSFRASLQLCWATGCSNTVLRSEAGSGPANSNSPSLGTPCCKLSLSDLSHNRHCPWGSPDGNTAVPVLTCWSAGLTEGDGAQGGSVCSWN